MWILPKNYPLSSHFAQDMVESKEDLTLPELNIESSLMLKSKPSPLRTWCRRWKPDSYLPHLFTRILKPSHRTCFEEKLASSLAVIPVNRSVPQESDSEKTTQDTCGLTLGDTSKQLDLFNASLKTSKDTSRLDSPQLSATWKKMVTEQRGEYSQRVKLALHIRESESISWPTPTTQDSDKANKQMRHNHQNGLTAVVFHREKMWPTPTAHLGQEGAYPAEYTRNTPTLTAVATQADGLPHSSGRLNPEWVEWLMGVPTGWTDLECWVTE